MFCLPKTAWPPTSGTTKTVTLPGTFKRVDGTSVTSVTLGARQAVILTK